jgi:hypothetical protein
MLAAMEKMNAQQEQMTAALVRRFACGAARRRAWRDQ